MAGLLNDYQRNSLTAVLRLHEHQLRQAQGWLQQPPASGILYRPVLRLSAEQRQLALGHIAKALALVAQVAQDLALELVEEDLGAGMAADMVVSWANLLDVRSDKLRGYGAVDARLGLLLDPYVGRLAELALELASIFRALEEL
ncbi:MAG: hypothetical protein ACUVWR_03780 [Anaerolineae bacterium]